MADETTSPPSGLAVLIFGRNPRRTMIRILVVLFLAFVVFGVLLRPIRVTGISMFPTYKDGQINLVNRLSYLRSEPQRGDVVAVLDPKINQVLLKRIIAMPGEQVVIDRGIIYIDGKELNEKAYLKVRQPWTEELEFPVMPERSYLLIGDNRSMPVSSHTHGIYHQTNFLGKVLF